MNLTNYGIWKSVKVIRQSHYPINKLIVKWTLRLFFSKIEVITLKGAVKRLIYPRSEFSYYYPKNSSL